MSDPVMEELRKGDTSKTNPFTIAIIANPALERPKGSGVFVVDPIVAQVGLRCLRGLCHRMSLWDSAGRGRAAPHPASDCPERADNLIVRVGAAGDPGEFAGSRRQREQHRGASKDPF